MDREKIGKSRKESYKPPGGSESCDGISRGAIVFRLVWWGWAGFSPVWSGPGPGPGPGPGLFGLLWSRLTEFWSGVNSSA